VPSRHPKRRHVLRVPLGRRTQAHADRKGGACMNLPGVVLVRSAYKMVVFSPFKSEELALAGRGVLQSKHAAGRESPRLTVSRGDGKATLQDDAELSCGRRMIETLFEVLSAPARVESSEECARGRKVASDVDWRRRRREVFLAELDRHVLKVRIS